MARQICQKKLLALKLPLPSIPHPNRKLAPAFRKPHSLPRMAVPFETWGRSWNMEVGDNVCTKNVKDSNNSGQSFNGCKLVYQILPKKWLGEV